MDSERRLSKRQKAGKPEAQRRQIRSKSTARKYETKSQREDLPN